MCLLLVFWLFINLKNKYIATLFSFPSVLPIVSDQYWIFETDADTNIWVINK